MRVPFLCVKVPFTMTIATKQNSPVNIEERKDLDIKAGDTVKVWQKIEEKGKTRLQIFEGLVLAVKHGAEAGATFTVRRVSGGVGVEKVFPLYSPMIDKIEIVRRSTVRQSKLYHLRNKVTKQIRREMRRMKEMGVATSSDSEKPREEEAPRDEVKEEESGAPVEEEKKESEEKSE